MGDEKEDAGETSLDLGLRDLLAIHAASIGEVGDEAIGEQQHPEEQPAPSQVPSLSPYALIAASGDWAALVRRCEEEGLRTPLSRVWWMRAHLEGRLMPVSLLMSAWERAQSEQDHRPDEETSAEASERYEVLERCRSWFAEKTEISKSHLSGPGDLPTKTSVPEQSSPPRSEPGNQTRFSAAPVSVKVPSGESEGSASGRGRPESHVHVSRSRIKRLSALGLILVLLGGILLARHSRDELSELSVPPMVEPPLPEVVPEMRLGELQPLSGLEVLHVAMEELVNVKGSEVESAEVVQKNISTAPIATATTEAPPVTPLPKAALMMDGPFEPGSVRDRRLYPERDVGPGGNSRGERGNAPSVWDQIGGMVTPPPRGGRISDPQDFFEGSDDHPGYPVERLREPQSCQLTVGGPVRTRPSDFAPSTSQLEEGDTVVVEQRMGPWLRLRGRSGRPGYVKSACRDQPEGGRRGDDDETEWRR